MSQDAWTDGYVTDIPYTYGYYNELNPLRIKLAFLNQGLLFPEVGTACELGYGQGLSVNIHASASNTHWVGTDFNPSHANFAQSLSQASQTDARLYDDSFEQFIQRTDLPDFDFIALHGIWSWISAENIQHIVNFIHRKLKVGGVVYVSYNTLPGWSSFSPFRHLLTNYIDSQSADGTSIQNRLESALVFSDKLLETQPAYAQSNPNAINRLNAIKEQSRHYLAHEYLNRDWNPMYFSEVNELLSPAKIQYACSANFNDHVDIINVTQEQRDFLNEISDIAFRETVRDFIINQQFRRDYWVRGPRYINPHEQIELIRSQQIILTSPISDVSLEVNTNVGKANLSEDVYRPLLELLADHSVKNIGQIIDTLATKNIIASRTVEAIIMLIGLGNIQPAQLPEVVVASKTHTDQLNHHLCKQARFSSNVQYLSSPVTGGGYYVSRLEQIFLLSISAGKKNASDWAKDAWKILDQQGQKLTKDGTRLETEKENIAELTEQAKLFNNNRLPILKALQIA